MYIDYYNWNKRSKELFQSCLRQLGLSNCQFYYPPFALFFKIYNTENSHRCIDFKRRYYVQSIDHSLQNPDRDDYDSNGMYLATLLDSKQNKRFQKPIFVKQLSILDTNHIVLNHYNLLQKRHPLLPSNYNHITYDKLNKIDNSVYIDCFASFLFGQLTEKQINPSFPLYYGCVNGIGNHRVDITEDIEEFESYDTFNKGLHTLYDINVYTSDDSKITGNEYENSESQTPYNTEEEDEDDFIMEVKQIPVQSLFIESLDGTFEDMIQPETYNPEILVSALFQITYALAYLQTHFDFVHNDLHINNIMYTSTQEEFYYYRIQDQIYKIPTYGYCFKIIDYGRSIYRFKGRLYVNDSFSKHGEADSQYIFEGNTIQNLNYSFDLCRLATTILDEFNENDGLYEESEIHRNIVHMLTQFITDSHGNVFYDGSDQTFQLYIDITEKAENSIPKDVLQNILFEPFKTIDSITHYYSLN
jgi:hypothetical protein